MNRFYRRLGSAREAIRSLTSTTAAKLGSSNTLISRDVTFLLGSHQIYSVPLSYSSCQLHLATALNTRTTEIVDSKKEAIAKLGESVKPLDVRPNMDVSENVGEELVGVLKKGLSFNFFDNNKILDYLLQMQLAKFLSISAIQKKF